MPISAVSQNVYVVLPAVWPLQYCKTVFKNLVLANEIAPESKFRKLAKTYFDQTRPAQRHHSNSGVEEITWQPDRHSSDSQKLELVDYVLKAISPKQAAMMNDYLLGDKVSNIARKFGVHQQTVYSAINRFEKRLLVRAGMNGKDRPKVR